ncbi:MAG: hypothetical protein L0H93_19725 [Nocardioides sp.]|nr:hypothetical protein [Nocardioides sp.]
MDDQQLKPYLKLLQRFVTAARADDCNTAWAMGNKNLHQAYGPKDAFCSKTLPAVAYIDLNLGRLEVQSPTYITLKLPHSQSVAMYPGRGESGPQIATTNLGTYEAEVAQ